MHLVRKKRIKYMVPVAQKHTLLFRPGAGIPRHDDTSMGPQQSSKMGIIGHDIAMQGMVPVSYSGTIDTEFDLIDLSREPHISLGVDMDNYNSYRGS